MAVVVNIFQKEILSRVGSEGFAMHTDRIRTGIVDFNDYNWVLKRIKSYEECKKMIRENLLRAEHNLNLRYNGQQKIRHTYCCSIDLFIIYNKRTIIGPKNGRRDLESRCFLSTC